MYFTYIIKSLVAPKTYVGHTNNITKRVNEHNQGRSIYTKRYKPWKVIHLLKFTDEDRAIRKEKYFKTAAGRRWMKKNLFNN